MTKIKTIHILLNHPYISVQTDIELADPNIKWDDVLGEYTLI